MIKDIHWWKKHLRESLLVFLFGMIFNWIFGCPKCIFNLAETWQDFVFTGIFWLVLWKGNEAVAGIPDRFLSWKERPMLRFLVGIAAHISYTFLASVVVNQIFSLIETGALNPSNWKQLLGSNFFTIIIALIITLFLTAKEFLISWRDLAVQHEQLRAEALSYRISLLKSQINPHFLFNSLNVLVGLVYKDPDLSAKFIQQLAEVYRYVLAQQDEDLVPIEQEISFTRSVIFLQKIRFGESLDVSLDISGSASFLVPPLAIQILIENAIKHNIISSAQPLHISLYLEDEYLVVTNNLQLKEEVRHTLGVGLENIRNRYHMLTGKEVLVIKDAHRFTVKLPKIKSK